MDSSYVLRLRGFQTRPGDADLRDEGSASQLRLHRRLCGDEQPGPDQWLEIHADQAVSGMSSSMLPPAAAASSVLYYLEAAVSYNLADVGPALENVNTMLQHPVDPSSSAFALHDLLL